MSSGYDPVSYPDKVHFASGEGGQEYRDDHDGYHESQNGNGIYNNYTVGPKTYGKPLKIACFKFENSRRSKFMLCCGVSVVIIIIMTIIVAVAAHKHANKQNSPPIAEKTSGLIAYGPDGNGMMKFIPGELDSFNPIFQQLEYHMHDYSPTVQLSELDTFMKCNSNMTSVPSGRECMQTFAEFGPNCQHYNMYGLMDGRPCVLLVLKLDEGVMPQPFNGSYMETLDGQLDLLDDKLAPRYKPSAVSISCHGKSAKDREHIEHDKLLGAEMRYNPAEGFQTYYFLNKKRTAAYVAPAVMVQFSTIDVNHPVTIHCTAWAQNFNNGKPQESNVYSTDFTISMTG